MVGGRARIVIVASFTVLAGRVGGRIDATAERLHSLSGETERLIDGLDSERPVFIQAYLSPVVPRRYLQTRNNIISTPVIYKGNIFVCTGHDPEHDSGEGHLWCIDPTKKLDGSDVSPELVVDEKGEPIPHRRLQAALENDRVIPNPNSAAVWPRRFANLLEDPTT